tara:strand:- start:1269 stop:2063 length:795 start_codon:yes stop_codon:yes gene_type:complete
MIEIFIFIISGIFIGVVAGLFGLGGGLLIVPVVTYSLVYFSDVAFTEAILIGIGTSLASMVLTGAMAVYAHTYNKNIDYLIIKKFAPGVIMGSIIIGLTIKLIPGDYLRFFFIIYTFFIAYKLLNHTTLNKKPSLPSFPKGNFISFAFAMISGLLGIGGATLFVPYLIKKNIPSKLAIGTSSAFGFLIGFIATFAMYISSTFTTTNNLSLLGYIYLPAIIFLTLPSLIFVKLSAGWLMKISDEKVKKWFAVLLFIIGISMSLNH